MPETGTLTQDRQQEIDKVGTADLVVGIPTYNHAGTVGGVIRAAEAGLKRFFPSLKAAIVTSDAGSTDGCIDRALEAHGHEVPLLTLQHQLDPANKLVTPYHGIPGRGEAFRTIFMTARSLGARACVILDADLRSIASEWIRALAEPLVMHEYDFVTPDYACHKYDATMNSGIVSPAMRAIYGAHVRYPVGGDLGLSMRLAEHCLQQEVWGSDIARFAIELWLTTHVLSADFRICQAKLGCRVHGTGPAPVQLSDTIKQVIGALYTTVEHNAAFWQRVRKSRPVPVFGDRLQGEAEPVAVNLHRMIEAFRLGVQNLQGVWSLVLPPAALLELRRMARLADESFRFADELWSRIVYDFCLGHHLRVIPRDHLLGALTPLYLGWLASFATETEQATSQEADERLEKLGLAFEVQKPYLISRWRWPDRFSP